jgi:glycerol-1-phosphate dehydrogenase [NAD(P)+]
MFYRVPPGGGMNPAKDSPPSLGDCLKAAAETEALLLKPGALGEIPALLGKHYDFTAVCLIADDNTEGAAGARVREALRGGGVPLAAGFRFPGEPRLHAEYGHIAAITGHLRALPAYPGILPVALGAGTLNDLVKRAASELGLPYLCVPTAASVDGYTSYGAALLAEGFKQTFPCAAPRALAADTELLRKAPPYLSSSGFGDLAGKLIAGTDWIIAEEAGALGAPGTEPIDPLAWSMTQTGLGESLRRSAAAWRGDGEAVTALFGALAMTGFAMQYLRSSRPVSGCEHLWSHIWEMEDLSVRGVPVTHGHKVALGALAATAFTELLFASPRPPLPAPSRRRPGREEREAEVRRNLESSGFGRPAIGSEPARAAVVKTALEKLGDRGETLAAALRDNWGKIRDRVLARLSPYGELRALLARGGCPLRPEELNLTRGGVIATARRAQMIRNRYTALDLAWDLGVFEEILSRMEESPAYLY